MLSKKLTFSLTSLVVGLMLAFATSFAVADHDHTKAIPITLSLDEDIQDVSSDGGDHVYSGRIRVVPYAEPVSVGIPADLVRRLIVVRRLSFLLRLAGSYR